MSSIFPMMCTVISTVLFINEFHKVEAVLDVDMKRDTARGASERLYRYKQHEQKLLIILLILQIFVRNYLTPFIAAFLAYDLYRNRSGQCFISHLDYFQHITKKKIEIFCRISFFCICIYNFFLASKILKLL